MTKDGEKGAQGSWRELCNSRWHKRCLQFFLIVVLSHLAEHLAQAVQIYFLGWPAPQARGVLGIWFPWLIKSEILHYLYALLMLVGIWIFKKGFKGRALFWWNVSLGIQFWHHIEHLLLQIQAIMGTNLMGAPVPMSVLQFWIPRVELHLFYNSIVFVPMMVGMYYHLFPSVEEESLHDCGCAYHPRSFNDWMPTGKAH